MASRKHKLEGQKTLFSCGVSRPEVRDKSDTRDESSSSDNAKCPRKFQSEWLNKFKWLKFDGERMTCTVCSYYKKDNVLTHGCANFKTSSLTDHIKSKDHQAAHEVQMQIGKCFPRLTVTLF